VRQGLFREDLFHRLNVIRLRLPSLRERREDIPLLAKHFLAEKRTRVGRGGETPVGGGDELPGRAGFPGQRAPAGKPVPLADGNGAYADHRSGGPAAGTEAGDGKAPESELGGRAWSTKVELAFAARETGVWTASRRPSKKALIGKALVRTGGRRIEAANLLGMGRNTSRARSPNSDWTPRAEPTRLLKRQRHRHRSPCLCARFPPFGKRAFAATAIFAIRNAIRIAECAAEP